MNHPKRMKKLKTILFTKWENTHTLSRSDQWKINIVVDAANNPTLTGPMASGANVFPFSSIRDWQCMIIMYCQWQAWTILLLYGPYILPCIVNGRGLWPSPYKLYKMCVIQRQIPKAWIWHNESLIMPVTVHLVTENVLRLLLFTESNTMLEDWNGKQV